MPRPGGRRVNEKSKDFFGSMKRLLSNLKPWKFIMIMALTLAMISAILALIAPNKLSDFTDAITEGLKPNTEKLEDISTSIFNNFSSENMKGKIPSILASTEISNEDKLDQELNSLKRINDSFKKVILVKENIMPWYDNNGILYLGIYDFLLNEDSLDI